MNLLPELDEKRTCNRVKKFFKRDLEKIVLMSGHRMVDLQSPQMTGMPSGSHFNSNEQTMINGLDAQDIVKSVNDALNRGVDPISRKILIGLYINHQRWVDVQSMIYKEHTSFSVYRNKALIAFAYSFEGWQIKNHCYKVIDLKVYFNSTECVHRMY